MILFNAFALKESGWGLLSEQHLVINLQHAHLDLGDVYLSCAVAEKVDVVFLDDGGVDYGIAVS